MAVAVAAMLTEPVTRPLPTTWQGSYTMERAQGWVDERVDEGTLVLVVERSTDILVELVITTDSGEGEIRLGYMIAEDSWGRGIASELVGGFIDWCQGRDEISFIAGGVGNDNQASIRVLEKNGFVLAEKESEVVEGQFFYRLTIR